MRTCTQCHTPIPAARLAALPTTSVCRDCSTEVPMLGWLEWSHKTAPTFQVVTPRQHAWLHAHDRKGVRSGLPMSPRTVSGSSGSLAGTPHSSASPTTIAHSSIPLATKCRHTDRPQASSAGKCVECAVQYYQDRADFAAKYAHKNPLCREKQVVSKCTP